MKFLIKKRIIALIIVSLFMSSISYAGGYFFVDAADGKTKFIDDFGKLAVGWRWLDINDDNICECYRFGQDGAIATKSRVKGKDVNSEGQWVVDGIVQQIYKSSGKPLYVSNAALGEKDTNKYLDFGTESNATKRLNATKKDVKSLMEADAKRDDDLYQKSLIGPKGEFIPDEKGYITGRGVKMDRKAPVATYSNFGMILNDQFYEDEVRVLSASESFIPGKDARKFVIESDCNKYTASANGCKVYGGEVWDDAIILAGNGASMKVGLVDTKSKFKANYVSFTLAHQIHGESTSDTYCGVEVYLNGKSVEVYDEFCDGDPEFVEIWMDEGETKIELKAIVNGEAKGRKIYIKNFRLRQIRDKKEDN